MRFQIDIEPVAKGRPRFSRGRVYTPIKTKNFEEEVRLLARKYKPVRPYTGPVAVRITCFIKKPKKPKHTKYPITRPDIDNYEKAILDSLDEFWVDDSQVVDSHTRKLYTPHGDVPHIIIDITPLT